MHATTSPDAVSSPQRGHWIERGPRKRLMVFSGRSHPGLAEEIADHLGVELGKIELKTFANDESYVRYLESIRGADSTAPSAVRSSRIPQARTTSHTTRTRRG